MRTRAPRPDGLETGLRLGCGAMFGLLLLGPLALRIALRSHATWLAFVLVPAAALVFAYLGYRWGDDLYRRWADGELVAEDSRWYWLLLLATFVGLVIWIWGRSRALGG